MTCLCACQRCMAGSCCLIPDPNRDGTARLFTRTNTTTVVDQPPVWSCGPVDHDFAALNGHRIYCRKCGATRKV